MGKITDNSVENSAVAVVEKRSPKPSQRKRRSSGKIKKLSGKSVITAICLAGAVLLFISGSNRVKVTFQKEKNNAYNEIYQQAYDSAERKNHVSNDAVISVTDARELSRLEVLTISDSEFVIKNESENDKTTSWLEVQGTGVFTVDLSAAEFIVDSQRKYVHVVIPAPVLTECTVSGTGKLFQRNGRFFSNGSVAEGVRLAQEQISEGRTKLEDTMKQSRLFHNAAKEAAVQVVKDLILQWNPTVSNLQVDVEFAGSH